MVWRLHSLCLPVYHGLGLRACRKQDGWLHFPAPWQLMGRACTGHMGAGSWEGLHYPHAQETTTNKKHRGRLLKETAKAKHIVLLPLTVSLFCFLNKGPCMSLCAGTSNYVAVPDSDFCLFLPSASDSGCAAEDFMFSQLCSRPHTQPFSYLICFGALQERS